jgi:hypothetical protein
VAGTTPGHFARTVSETAEKWPGLPKVAGTSGRDESGKKVNDSTVVPRVAGTTRESPMGLGNHETVYLWVDHPSSFTIPPKIARRPGHLGQRGVDSGPHGAIGVGSDRNRDRDLALANDPSAHG